MLVTFACCYVGFCFFVSLSLCLCLCVAVCLLPGCLFVVIFVSLFACCWVFYLFPSIWIGICVGSLGIFLSVCLVCVCMLVASNPSTRSLKVDSLLLIGVIGGHGWLVRLAGKSSWSIIYRGI